MTRPDQNGDAGRPRPRPLVIHRRDPAPDGSDLPDLAPVAARLRRLAAAMRAVADAGEPVAHGDGVAWNEGAPDMLGARRLNAEEEGTSLAIELRCDHDGSGRTVVVVGTIAPVPGDRRLPDGEAVVALAGFVEAFAEQIGSDDPIGHDDWTAAVRTVVGTPPGTRHPNVAQRLHLAASPIHGERRVDLVFDGARPEADPEYRSVAIDAGLPPAMLAVVSRDTSVPLLVNAMVDLDLPFGDDPVGTLRGIARVTATTGWAPPATTPDDDARGDDA